MSDNWAGLIVALFNKNQFDEKEKQHQPQRVPLHICNGGFRYFHWHANDFVSITPK